MTLKIIYVLNANGEPLMPTHRLGMVRHWLNGNEAHWYGNRRDTIQFDRPVGNKTQECIEGVDLGNHLGLSVVCPTTNQELYSSVSHRDYQGEVKRNTKRREQRRSRRNRLRHRKARFNNRRKPDGWLAPSIQHYLNFTVREIKQIQQFLPMSKVILETTVFDIAKLTNFGIRPQNYTKGRLHGYHSLKQYLYDQQNGIDPLDGQHYQLSEMVVHHLNYRSQGGTNSPDNTILLSRKNHNTTNHNNGVLKTLAKHCQSSLVNTKGAFLMNIMHIRLPKLLSNKLVQITFGYKTAQQRQLYGFIKNRQNILNHAIDAMLIANGNNRTISMVNTIYREKHHRNNRCLEKFYDAKYYSKVDGKVYSGKELSSGRTNRKQNRIYNSKRSERGYKKAKGRRSIRRQHYSFQPHDKILYQEKIFECKGTMNRGKSVQFKLFNGKLKSTKPTNLKTLHHANSWQISLIEQTSNDFIRNTKL